MKESKTYTLLGEQKRFEEIKKYLDSYYQTVIDVGYKHRMAYVLDMIPKQGFLRTLDYGCGWGVFTRILSEHNAEADIIGIDIDKNSLGTARKWLGNKHNIDLRDCSIYEFESKTFDYVISMEVIEHVHNPGNYLKGISRVLKNDGILIATLPNIIHPLYLARLIFRHNMGDYLKRHSEFILNSYDKTTHHINGWDPFHFTTLVSSLGFKVQNVRMVDGVPIPFVNKITGKKSNTYWYTRIPYIRNLSYRMVFKLKKVQYIDLSNED